MARRMLINAIHPEETRVAIADDDRLIELEVERADSGQLRGNIYRAAITRIEPSLQAAFLDIGSERNGFLQINDINPAYFQNIELNGSGKNRPHIQDVLSANQELIVQVVKDSRDAKGATLTTNLSIPGRYLVLMVGNQRGGVSRKIQDESQRSRLRQAIRKLSIPAGMGVIVRTAGINKTSEELQKDLDSLLDIWYGALEPAPKAALPATVYQESGLAVRMLRDYLTDDIDEVLIDDAATHKQATEFVGRLMPGFVDQIKKFEDQSPIFSNFHLDTQIDATNQPMVTLPSGGSIVINATEAVVAIDVNSGRSTGEADVEGTAFATNKEAAQEIARQLRLRDLGGLIVVDFIDMWDKRHKQVVEKTMREAVRDDKAKIEMGRISKFGLLEMSRQRLKSSLVTQSSTMCNACAGRGRVKSPDVAALEALRKIQSSVFSGGVQTVRVRMAPSAALFLLNNKRRFLADLEAKTSTSILVFADGRMRPAEYQLELDTQHHHEPITQSSEQPSHSRDRTDSSGGRGRNTRGRSGRRGRSSGDRRGGRGGERRGRGRGSRSSNNGRGRSRNSRNENSSAPSKTPDPIGAPEDPIA